MIPIYVPFLQKYKKSAINAIEENWISNYGVNISNAEEKLCNILGVKHCILMNNGTAATHSLFVALKHFHPSIKKIYVPNNVFVACWNCALMEYSSNEIEVLQTNEETLNMETSDEYIQSLEKDSAILVVHNLGNVINVPRLKRLRPDIVFMEDNCEGLFGKYENIYSGSYKDTFCSSVSFYANKTLTTGEGGAFFTNNKDVYEFMRSTYSHGMTTKRYIHDKLAYNYRMTNIQAGFLYDQLCDIRNILELKENIFKNYDELMKKLFENKKIKKYSNEKDTTPGPWMYCILINGLDFSSFENFMDQKLVQVRPFFYDITKHIHLKDITNNHKECTIFKHGLMLPSYPGLEKEKQEYIVNCIKEYLELK